MFDPVVNLAAVKIGQEQGGRRDDGENRGSEILLITNARALDRQQVGAGNPSNDRHDQKRSESHAAEP